MDEKADLSKEKKEQIIEALKAETASNNEVLSNARKYHNENQQKFLLQLTAYTQKISDISFVLGAAIGPLVIATKTEIKDPEFVFLAIALYFTAGTWALWKTKGQVEKGLDSFQPSALHGLESEIYPMSFAANKLLLDLVQGKTNENHKNEYREARGNFLESNTDSKTKINSRPDLTLDFLLAIFIFASLMLLNTIWPFSQNLYWLTVGIVSIILLSVILISSIKARRQIEENKEKTKKLEKMKKDHLDWQKSEGLV